MKYLGIILLLLSTAACASTKAVTENGDVVFLYPDGTWAYQNPEAAPNKDIPTNSQSFSKPEQATFKLKSKTNNSAVWVDAESWLFKKATNNVDAEYQFRLKGEDLYGMLITEQIEVSPEVLAELALENAQAFAPDMRITKQEYRTVNGLPLVYMEMQGTMKGINITYLGYYYSNDTGTTQFVSYTGTRLTDKYRSDIDSLLNGFTTD